MKEEKKIEYLDEDFLGNKVNIGDKVIFQAPDYRMFTIGTVITKANKSCQIEYLNTWNFPTKGRKLICRQGYNQIIKQSEGKWISLEPEIGLFACSLCDHRILRAECNFCPNCGAKMDGKPPKGADNER